MPIQLDNLDAVTQSNVKIYSPKFFDKKLTGNGGKTGLLKEERNPVYIPQQTLTTDESVEIRKRKITNGDTETTYIPLSPLTPTAWSQMRDIHKPDDSLLTTIATLKKANNHTTKVQLYMPVHSLILEEKSTKTGNTKQLKACYQIILFFTDNATNPTYQQVSFLSNYATTNRFWYKYSCNPSVDLNTITNELANCGYTVNSMKVLDFISNYSLYDAIVARSEEWNVTLDKTLNEYFNNVTGITLPSNKKGHTNTEVIKVIRRIENYNIPLDLYRRIYDYIKAHFYRDDVIELCKQNLNLLLSDTLNHLDKNKSKLTHIPATAKPVNVPGLNKFSHEQQKAITSHDPLILVQAGAGTGKSTVILGRIEYMIASGIKPEDITVLSFTNAAADHIKEKNSNVHSMTIASMIHSIYELNFPEHELSNIDTVINSLEIYYPQNDLAEKFRKKLLCMKKNERDSFTTMNNFIEQNYDEVIGILNTLKQTALELEIIICYQQIDKFKEPASVASKYLIIDEVQDNSIFEFVYTLKYVDKHRESLFIVGDCSQTLYEFRASNPKALNVLEGSGVFTTYQLQINYRSNQEILDFANVALQNIEANQYANIRLRANSLSPVTEQSFTDAVKFSYTQLNKLKDFDDALSTILVQDVKPYIEAKLQAGEKIAFLAFTRKHVALIEKTLKHMFPTKSIVSIVPERMHNSVVFSEFIKRYWDEIKFVPTQSLAKTISQTIIQKLSFFVYDQQKSLPFVQKLIADWRNEEDVNINMWTKQYINKQITFDELMEYTKDCMLQFEIRHNAIKQALLSARNDENKNKQNVNTADIILSTIHSAKGLEFDNVVIVYQNSNYLDEEKKRMYYVAFTRAMKSEYIIAYDTVKSPQIQVDYDTIIRTLRPATANTAKTITI